MTWFPTIVSLVWRFVNYLDGIYNHFLIFRIIEYRQVYRKYIKEDYEQSWQFLKTIRTDKPLLAWVIVINI